MYTFLRLKHQAVLVEWNAKSGIVLRTRLIYCTLVGRLCPGAIYTHRYNFIFLLSNFSEVRPLAFHTPLCMNVSQSNCLRTDNYLPFYVSVRVLNDSSL